VAWERFVEEKMAAGFDLQAIQQMPEARLKNIGLTATDLVAPFFVFIVGLCIPLSRANRGAEWWRRVFSRTAMLILAGILYISLILGLSWWWGILQAIGISYLIGASSLKLPRWGRWVAVFGLLGFHLLMSHSVDWWLHFGDSEEPFFTISRLDGSWAKPLRVHCLPWVSISYGAMTLVGVLLGETVRDGDRRRILLQSLKLGLVFFLAGWLLHQIGMWTGAVELCFNKPDVTASYAMAASGLASLFFGLLYYLIDVRRYRFGLRIFTVLGVNALLAYFMQIVMRLFFRATHIEPFFSGAPNPVKEQWAGLIDWSLWRQFWLDRTGYGGMLWGAIWCACLWLIIFFCNKKKFYWKL
jgi:predicted acyltransferase